MNQQSPAQSPAAAQEQWNAPVLTAVDIQAYTQTVSGASADAAVAGSAA
jgi:hypothetical protein